MRTRRRTDIAHPGRAHGRHVDSLQCGHMDDLNKQTVKKDEKKNKKELLHKKCSNWVISEKWSDFQEIDEIDENIAQTPV